MRAGISVQINDYVDLDGAQGKDVFFRPERYHLADLGPIGVEVQLCLAGKHHRCELYDISQNGVAFGWPDAEPIEVGQIIEQITISFDAQEAYRGEARVGSIRCASKKTIVGVSFVDTLMNIEDVLHLRDVKAWSSQGAKDLGFGSPAWKIAGYETFKAAVSELRLLLEDANTKLGELESALPWYIAHAEHDSLARDALIERVQSELVAHLVQASEEIDTALRAVAACDRQSLKEYSLRQVHSLMMQSPWMRRAHTKPLGYPGDYEIMNGLYGNHFAGPTLFAKAVNLWAVSTGAARAVRTRKDLLKTLLRERLTRSEPNRPRRILSIAAGPAQEVFEVLTECPEFPERVEIVLFDQDKGALAYAYGRLNRLPAAKNSDHLRITYRHDSIKRLLRDAALFRGYGEFDAIYCSGLFDYLQLPTAVRLCKNLYENLARGGSLYIGNMVPSNPSRWIMEFHLDWFLQYRERSQLLDMARMAVVDAQIEILEEASQYNPFVVLSRR
jgi:extracellular factor (EF) 3-hydroxypalmitic acid methyl ester biosynthesis protein